MIWARGESGTPASAAMTGGMGLAGSVVGVAQLDVAESDVGGSDVVGLDFVGSNVVRLYVELLWGDAESNVEGSGRSISRVIVVSEALVVSGCRVSTADDESGIVVDGVVSGAALRLPV